MFDLPPLLKAALQLRAETDISRFFLPDVNTPNQPPLWQALKTADASCASDFISPEARAIIAMRDWILQLPNGYDWSRMQAQALANVLTVEANLAERGEVQ